MAALTSAGVAVLDNYQDGGNNGKKFSVFVLNLTLSTNGSVANPIPASVLGLTKIIKSSEAVKSDNSAVIPTAPSIDGSMLLFGGGASNAPADYTGTFKVHVWGFSS